MDKPGKYLEKLTEKLEALLSDSSVEVHSPEYITGRLSKCRREVDVSLRTRMGSSTILVVMECRDRIKPQDLQWIDGIAGKLKDVGANKAVAVSKSGFTPCARSLAKAFGIELRTLEEVHPASLWDWLGFETVALCVWNLDIRQADIRIPASTSREAMSEVQSLLSGTSDANAPILIRTRDGTQASIIDVWRETPSPDPPEPPPPGIAMMGKFLLIPPDQGSWYAIPVGSKEVEVSSIQIEGVFRIDERQIPISQWEYRGDGIVFTQGVHAKFMHEDSTVEVVIHSASDSPKLAVTVDQTSGARPLGIRTSLHFGTTGDDEESPSSG